MKEWEDLYAGYVIRQDKCLGQFIWVEGICACRNMAVRFTKQGALNYIENGCFCKELGGSFVIEDAT